MHVDVKKLGRIRPGGGWRILGQSTESEAGRGRGVGYDFIHTAIDDHSRYAYVEVHPDERGGDLRRVLAARGHSLRRAQRAVERVMTDRAKNYVLSAAFGVPIGRASPREPVRAAHRWTCSPIDAPTLRRAGTVGSFTADITFDEEVFVSLYDGFLERISD